MIGLRHMINPFRHIDWGSPQHLLYAAMLITSPVSAPLMVLTGPPGWFVGIFWIAIFYECRPDSITDAQLGRRDSLDRQAKRAAWQAQWTAQYTQHQAFLGRCEAFRRENGYWPGYWDQRSL